MRIERYSPLLITAALAACAGGGTVSKPEQVLPAQYANAPAAAGPAIGADWWITFGDSTLNTLVDATLKNNVDLKLAVARVDESAAVLGLARATQWPEIDVSASSLRSRASTLNNQPITQPVTTSNRLALSTSFELDFWGRLRNASNAAQAQLLAAQDGRDTVRIALAASTAQAYFGLRALDAQLAVNEAALRSRGESLSLIERRLNRGLGSPLDKAQAQAALAAVAAQRPELQRQRGLLENQLGLLTGQPGLSLPVATALPTALLPPAGLPSELLTRRPDIRQAENQLRAAQAQVEVVRAAIWPTITLTGSFGGQSAELADLFRSGARIWSIGPSLLAPLFDAGRNAARTDQARAQAEQAAIGYAKAVQTAFRETADALLNSD
ncbi:MAG: efflux transporter outer membrane subunit, partial [Burkholderiales bacterium]|nr:efflux transporter outer membrane subunit [Burkholderiales bacterium]